MSESDVELRKTITSLQFNLNNHAYGRRYYLDPDAVEMVCEALLSRLGDAKPAGQDDEYFRDICEQGRAASDKIDRAGFYDEATLMIQLVMRIEALKAQALDTARALADRTYELTLAHQELERWKAEAASENEKANRLFADLEKVTKEASR